MSTTPFLLAVASTMVLLLSCGGEQDSAVAADVGVPLEGKSVSGSGQILGVWMRVTPGEFTGLEFGKDDRVRMTFAEEGGAPSTVTASYEVLEDGRLSLVGALGMTEVFRTQLRGDVLELTSEASGDPPQRFTRLPGGQTLALGLRAQQEQLEGERARRKEAFRTQLLADDLVLVRTDDAAPGWRMFLEQDPKERGVSGSLHLEESPVAADARPAVRSFLFEARFDAVGELSSALAVTLTATPAVPPLFDAPITGAVTLALEGPVDQPTATGTAHFPALSELPVGLVAERDASANAELARLLEERAELVSRELAELADVLGAELRMQGKRIIDGPNWRANTASVKLQLEGDGQHRYTTLVGLASQVDLPATATLDMHAGRAALFLTLPSGEQWRLQPDGDSMRGAWRPDARSDFGGHGEEDLQLDLQIVHRTSREDAATARNAVDKFWNVDLLQGVHFTGRLEARGAPYRYAALEVRTTADGSRTATVWLAAQRGGGGMVLDSAPSIGGTSERDAVGLTTASWMESSSFMVPAPRSGSLRLFDPIPTLELSLTLEDGKTLEGFFSPVDAATYRVAEDALLASLRDKTFGVSMATQPLEASLRFGPLEDPSRIEAEVLGEAPGLWAQPASPGVFRGAIVNAHFIPVLRGTVYPEEGSDRDPIEIEMVQTNPNPKMGLSGWTAASEGSPQQLWFHLAPPR